MESPHALEESRDDYRRFHRKRHAALLEVLERHVPQKAARCLDIGGGGDIGGLGTVVKERFAEELHAVDLGDDVDRASARGILAKRCDIDKELLPYEEKFFDLVVFCSVIEHLFNPHWAMNEIERVIKPGGVLIVEAPNAVALGRRLDALAGRNPFAQFHRYNFFASKAFMVHCSVFYTAEEVSEWLAADFDVLETRYAMHTPPVNPIKGLVRAAAARINPRLSDCFFVAVRKR